MKNFNLVLLYPNKRLWLFDKKKESDDIIQEWQRDFIKLDLKRRNFLKFLSNNFIEMISSYTQGGS